MASKKTEPTPLACSAPGYESIPILLYKADESTISYNLKSLALQFNPSTGVAVLSFNQPRKLNPFQANTHYEMHCTFLYLKRNPAIKVVVWTGAGDKAFCVGADFAEQMMSPTIHVPEEIQAAMETRGLAPKEGDIALKRLTFVMHDFPKPIICAVNGLAIGAGANWSLAGCADFTYAVRSAKFGFPFVTLGICPEIGSSFTLASQMGLNRFKEVIYRGGFISATEAHSYGLVNTLFDSIPELMAHSLKIAEEIATKSATSLRITKQMVNKFNRNVLETHMDTENAGINECVASPGTDRLVCFCCVFVVCLFFCFLLYHRSPVLIAIICLLLSLLFFVFIVLVGAEFEQAMMEFMSKHAKGQKQEKAAFKAKL